MAINVVHFTNMHHASVPERQNGLIVQNGNELGHERYHLTI